jgi:hypothetical protein
MAPVCRGHLSIEVRLSGGGFRLQRPISGRVFDDNLLALVIADVCGSGSEGREPGHPANGFALPHQWDGDNRSVPD